MRWDFPAIGTAWQVQTETALSPDDRRAVLDLVDAFDRDWSRFREDSLVSGLARRGGSVPAPADAKAMLDLYVELADATGGAVNPLVGDALARRGYDAGYGFVDRGAQGAPEDWRERLTWDDTAVTLTGAAILDVGAVGKGRLVDRVGALVAQRCGGAVVVDASGDLAVHGGPGVRGGAGGHAERVALEHPFDPRRAIGVWEVTDAALCASATNRRAWGDGLHHVLDARTGEPVRTIAATWAVAPEAMTADAAATALFFDGGPEFAHRRGVQWVRMTTDGRVEWSPGCRAELFL